MIVPESAMGVCLWEMPEESYGGGFLAEERGVFLCIEGVVGDREIEINIEKAARYWLDANADEYVGQPHWIRGARQVTNNEYDDQMDRLVNGQIPDWEEAARIAYREATNK